MHGEQGLQAKRESEIPAGLELGAKLSEELHQRIDALASRLTPALRPATEPGGKDQKSPGKIGPSTQYGVALDRINCSVSAAIDKINALNHFLEL